MAKQTKEILIDEKDIIGVLKKISRKIKGSITQKWGEFYLNVDNEIAKGEIRAVYLESGISLIIFDIIFFQEVLLEIEVTYRNPLYFLYCLRGTVTHRRDKTASENQIDRYQNVIFASSCETQNFVKFPLNKKLNINNIQIGRKEFSSRKLSQLKMLNAKLREVFLDIKEEDDFEYFGEINLELADNIEKIINLKEEGVIRLLMLEGLVFYSLAQQIKFYNNDIEGIKLPYRLSNHELENIRETGHFIIKNYNMAYTVKNLSLKTGIDPKKLQTGFKYLFAKTVGEFIRDVKLEESCRLIREAELSISEIVYKIGYNSRSYFSKIFKERYNLLPSEYALKTKKILKELED
ncbi:helix-turn-helix transcriptional regulator [Aquimarina sp. U1-2]|uniref:helix-turn-helix domain-containing protein n=1 Tax=Aquimarina sp. U1-2 TaxID=2823141 RepID=UPI001AECEA2D|nr:AraC family transcriptional regulator [Aquimarina sp. U1-2]MBP2833688.1 helix-turn-helix transcriptional regulator [Aquimarina sp. U1-2]